MEHLTFLIPLKGCVLNIHLLPLSANNNNLLVTQKYNVQACRKEITMFVLVDEQPFRVVEGKGRKLQPLFVIHQGSQLLKLVFNCIWMKKLD